ncbi:MAG: hypothetical protein IT384_06855 [Deltaproteobacteria bacterium]|nr:hypothetical protein [Deltaproteobacteria bacterium]
MDDTFAPPQPDRATFDLEAGPLLAKRCADTNCHGMDRPFALYAVGRRRADARLTFSPEPLSAAEVDANYTGTLGFLDAPRLRDTTLLRKAIGMGGLGGHRGGAIFAAPSDPECRAIERWIRTAPEYADSE